LSPPRAIGAFFDLDGTLLPYPSLEWRFIGYLLRNKKISWSNVANWMARAAGSLTRGPRMAFGANKSYLAGLSPFAAVEWEDKMASGRCHRHSRLKIFAEGSNRIAWHQSQNHRVFLVSGTLAPLARAIADLLPGRPEAWATELAMEPATELATDFANEDRRSAIWTGELAGAHLLGEAKRDCLLALAKQHDLELSLSYAYGDSITDCAMLECVGHPETVNPSWSLRRAARTRGWPISRWSQAWEPQETSSWPTKVVSRASEVPAARQSR
jgi:phosphoserine phosphatase